MSVQIASSLDEALTAIANGARPVAGGTDLVVGARQGSAPLPDAIVAIDRLSDLQGIFATGDALRIGAAVTHAQLMTDATIVDRYSGLADAAALVGSPSTRNVGTIGGNVMNASPAMDTGAPLIVLGATAELARSSGTREIELSDLWTGPGTTSADADELCTAVLLPAPTAGTGSAYVRLEYRRAMEIAVVGAAAAVTLNPDGSVASVRLALAAVAPTIIAVDGLDITGASPDDAATAAASAARDAATPISDLRASDAYRLHTVGVMAGRAVAAAARRAAGEQIAVPINRSLGIGAAR